MAATEARVIDAAVRFLRTNPEVVAYARTAAPGSGVSVDAILADAVRRLRQASVAQPVPGKELSA